MNEGCIMMTEHRSWVERQQIQAEKKTSIFHRRCNKKTKDERERKGQQRALRTKDEKQELEAIFYEDKIWKMSPNFIVA